MSETLAFEYFPASTWRPSGFYAEFNASQANTATQPQRALLFGQVAPGAPAVLNTAVMAYTQNQVNLLCGADSMLALSYAAYRKQDAFGEVWICPVADPVGGVQPTYTLTFGGPATATGTLALYAIGVPCPVGVNAGDTPSIIAANVAAALNLASIPCTAAAVAGVVTVTSLHKGLAFNDFDFRLNYVGVQNGETTPAGVTMAVAAAVTGALGPSLTSALANLGVQTFDFISCPYTDSASLAALEGFLSDSAGRWAAIEMLYGHVFAAFNGTVGARATFGAMQNNQHVSILGYPGGAAGSPTPAWLEAADWCGAHALQLKVNPAIGLTGLALGLLPPPLPVQDTPSERNSLLYDGISTFTVDDSGTCRIDRSITTYQKNTSGQIDNSYLNTNLLFQAMYVARYIAAQVTSMYIDAGKILVANGTPIAPGSPATTPSLILQSVIAMYSYLCTLFVVQNASTFAQNATSGTGQKGQVLLYLPLDFSDQVIQVAALFEFVQST